MEIATGSDHEEEILSPPPLPPRTTSSNPFIRTLGVKPVYQLEENSDPSDPTSSDVSEIQDDDSSDSSDSDSDEGEDVKKLKNGQRDFDANSSLPPVPNGTLDLTKPSDKQRFSSDEER